jgi:ABC transporter substrate binding protein
VGFLRQAGPDEKQFEAFRGGLRAAGYIEGQNIVIEQRYAAGTYDRLPGLAMELAHSNVDVIVVDGTAAAKACKDITSTTPVVFTLAVDPVADGLVASIAHPGGNLTGLTMTTGYELAGKRLELLKDMVAIQASTANLLAHNTSKDVSGAACRIWNDKLESSRSLRPCTGEPNKKYTESASARSQIEKSTAAKFHVEAVRTTFLVRL